jgi:hypothetical protein
VLAAVPRLLLLFVIVWALTGPIDRMPPEVGAAGLVAGAPAGIPVEASPAYQETGFAVADGPIASYFVARGGVRTFGPPVSNEFILLGARTQIFRNHALKVEPNGTVSPIDLFALGAIPFRNVGGRIVPEVDQALLASAPIPGTPDYGTRVQAFIQANAPDRWEDLPVGFYQAFRSTVRPEDAFPNGGAAALLPGFSQEVWGVPVSKPVRDAQNPDAVVLRWERGVMVWNRQDGSVVALPLGETFKQVLTGEGLGPERTAAAAGSPFLMQLKAGVPNGLARPEELPNTSLDTAFAKGNAAINAAQLAADPYATATPTPFAPPAAAGSNLPPPPPPAPGALGAPVNAALPGAPPSPPTGYDPCYHDEQITFAPAEPRANNELLIAVTSSRPHPYGRLAGTEKTNFMRERQGQLGYVWEWTVALTYPGQHTYTFYVDSTVPCKAITIDVREQLATRTPTPTKAATPWGWDNGNSNNNSNNSNGNNNDNNSGMAPFRDLSYIYTSSFDSVNCSFFQSQGEAQRTLRSGPSDPNQIDIEDGVRDGIACSTNNYRWAYPDDRDFGIIATPVPVTVATLTRAQRTPGVACLDFASGQAAQDFLRANPGDPLYMDYQRDGRACTNADAPGMPGGLFMNPPLADNTKVPTPPGGP